MNNFILINRVGLYDENDGITNIFSVYKNEINENKEIISIETVYPKRYDENNNEIIEFEILWYNSLKHLNDLHKFINWLYGYGSGIKRNDDETYNLVSVSLLEKEPVDFEEYETKNPLFQNYILNDIEFVDESCETPFNDPIDFNDENCSDDDYIYDSD
jgi:hypothetical protein